MFSPNGLDGVGLVLNAIGAEGAFGELEGLGHDLLGVGAALDELPALLEAGRVYRALEPRADGPDEHEAGHSLGIVDGKVQHDAGAERPSHQNRLLYIEAIQEGSEVFPPNLVGDPRFGRTLGFARAP